MKKVLSSLLLFATLLPAAGELSLEKAVKISLKSNHSVKAGLYQVKGLTQSRREAFSRYLPRVNAAASYTRLDNAIDLDLSPLRDLLITLETSGGLADLNLQSLITRGTPLTDAEKSVYSSMLKSNLENAIPSLDMHVLDRDVFRLTLDFLQPIWMGGRLRALNRSARLREDSGRQDLLLTQEKVVEETIRIYFLNRFLEDVLALRREVAAGIDGHADRAESLYQAGLIARYQWTRARVARGDAQRNVDQAEADLAAARAILTTLLHLADGDSLTLTTPLPYFPMQKTAAEWKRNILARNATLEKIRLGRRLVGQKRKADLGEYLPQVFAFGSYEVLRDDLSLLDPAWRVGIGMKLNLFSGGEKLARIRKDRLLEKEVAENEAHVADLLKQLTDKLYHAARKEQHTLDHAPLRLEEAEENLRLAESRFSSGLGISLEVVDAHLQKEKVRTQILQARYNYLSQQLKLHELSLDLTGFIKSLEEKR